MLINFALGVVGTRVTSDKVSTDGHECSNLISSNWHLRRKGFIAESFIKPPVNLTFEFPCNVKIHHIYVTPCVGQQVSSHLELYSASKPLARPATELEKQQQHTVSGAFSEGLPSSDAPPLLHLTPPFYPVAKMNVSDGGRICFYNAKAGTNSTTYGLSNCYTSEIKHFRQEIISASSHLSIRIVRTVGGSAAAISSIEIWGQPAASVSSVIRNDIVIKYTSFINQLATVKDCATYNNKQNGTNPTVASVTDNTVNAHRLEIPEEFLDPITCEVMAVPMLLPSGKNVDLSTLDHYFSVEASYGRQPRDPFTGLQFTNTSKPIPNGALKTRIDKFLMQHCDDPVTSTIARTVSTLRGASMLGKRKNSDTSHGHISSLISQCSGTNDVNGDNSKHIKITESVTCSSQQQCQQSTEQQPTNSCNDSSSCISHVSLIEQKILDCNSKQNRSSDHTHEIQLKNSLDFALSSILNGLPSYSSQPPHTENKDCCSFCQVTLSETIVSYTTPCKHYVCRSCLTSDTAKPTMVCGSCGHIFNKSSVSRKHHYETCNSDYWKHM